MCKRFLVVCSPLARCQVYFIHFFVVASFRRLLLCLQSSCLGPSQLELLKNFADSYAFTSRQKLPTDSLRLTRLSNVIHELILNVISCPVITLFMVCNFSFRLSLLHSDTHAARQVLALTLRQTFIVYLYFDHWILSTRIVEYVR